MATEQTAIGPERPIWRFLNSSLGLWLLSAIFISGAGSIYAQYQARDAERAKKTELDQQEKQKTKDLVERLDLEIGYRLSQSIQSLYLLLPDRNGCPSEKAKLLCAKQQQVVRELAEFRTPRTSLFPEYGSHSTLALVGELSRHVPESEKKALRGVMNMMSGASLLFEGKSTTLHDPKALAKSILDNYALPRWEKGWFFIDCKGNENPFC